MRAHRTKKEKEKMSNIEKFVTEGNEKADELAKAGAMQELERTVDFCRQEKGENEASNISVYEMRKKKQIHENARQM